MKTGNTITSSRRRFIGTSLKLAGFSLFLLPLQKAFGSTINLIQQHAARFKEKIAAIFSDRLVLNTKTKVVHLPTKKIFEKGLPIAAKHTKFIDLKTWETQVKSPIHFDKKKSGIIIEVLALQKIATVINDKSLTAMTATLKIAFSKTYYWKNGTSYNKFNYRLHELLLQAIALNNSIPADKKWDKFQEATGGLYYGDIAGSSPKRMAWLINKQEFDRQANYILTNKTKYLGRLEARATINKL